MITPSKANNETQRRNDMETEYKGYIIFKYENAKGGKRWGVEKDGIEILADQTRKYLCIRKINDLVSTAEWRAQNEHS